MTYKILAEFPHDQDAFTQGIEYALECEEDGKGSCTDVFWESTGMYGQSTVRRVRISDGHVLESHALPARDFGEGLTRLNSSVYQITWRQPDGHIYSTAGGLRHVGPFKTELRDGWGLANDGQLLLATDSGHMVHWIDPDQGFKTVKSIAVTSAGVPVRWLNELELIDGDLYANVWQTECIARIDLASGAVTHWYLMHGLRGTLAARPATDRKMDVLNGIAWDAVKRRLFVTGKYWPAVFQVELTDYEPGQAPSKEDVASKCVKRGRS